MKTLRVRLSKAIIDNDIDQRTFKRMEASFQNAPETSKDAVASDTEEDHDAAIVTRYRDYRDAKLRKRLIKYLEEDSSVEEFTNAPRSTEPEYVYTFSVPDDFRSELMGDISVMMHEYIVRGTIYDWYKYAGIEQKDNDSVFDELEDDILYNLGSGGDLGDGTHRFVLERTNTDGSTIYRFELVEAVVSKEVDAVTRKYTDASDLKKANLRPEAISSNSSSDKDGLLISRYINRWSSELKTKLRFCICPVGEIPAVTPEDGVTYIFFKFKAGFEPGVLTDITSLIHNFVTNGVLYEWYRSMNVPIASTYIAETDETQTKIVSLLRQALPAVAPHGTTLLHTNADGSTIWRIAMSIDDIIEQVDTVTRKLSDVADRKRAPLMPDAISSDFIGSIDAGIVTRYISKWASELRNRIRIWMCPKAEIPHGSELPDYENFIFKFRPGYDTNVLPEILSLIQTQLFSGAIYDWYHSIGSSAGNQHYSAAIDAQDKTLYTLRGKPTATRPLQPFGPPFPKTPLF